MILLSRFQFPWKQSIDLKNNQPGFLPNRKFTVSSFKEKILTQSAKKPRSNTSSSARISRRFYVAVRHLSFRVPGQFFVSSWLLTISCINSHEIQTEIFLNGLLYVKFLFQVSGHCDSEIKISLFLLAIKGIHVYCKA